MRKMKIPNWMKALAGSRKFWVALVAVFVLGVALAQGAIEAEQFADALQALALAVILAIAGEDIAAKASGRHPSQQGRRGDD